MKNQPVNAEALFQRGFHVEQFSPKVYGDVMQAANSLVNANPAGRLLSTSELQQRAVCLGWIAGLYPGKTLHQALATLQEVSIVSPGDFGGRTLRQVIDSK